MSDFHIQQPHVRKITNIFTQSLMLEINNLTNFSICSVTYPQHKIIIIKKKKKVQMCPVE